ncbi:MAG: NRDE family protein [Deltaproteobacteria bacterium]|nr:NRDE family protein [Deltaproteobacteria bacterium]
MCTLAIYVQRFAEFPLVVAANRDEFLARPATAPLLLSIAPRVVGGRDLFAGGTWLGISEHGVAAGLLNRRTAEPPVDGKRSRGLLLLETLAAASAADAARALAAIDPDTYNAFTLLVADATTAVAAQNRPDGMHLTPLDPGVHVLSNLDVNDPMCPKVARSHERFARAGDAFQRDGDAGAFRAALRAILSDHTIALDPRLPDALGSLCVHTETFGTRCSSLAFLDRRGAWRHWFADGAPCRAVYEPALIP